MWWALGLNGAFMIVEFIGAAMSGSLALAADAVHMGSDVVALAVALTALLLSRRLPTARYTFGWHRAEMLGAQLNAAILFGAAGLILVEAIRRIGQPAEIEGATVIVIAVIGLAVNVAAALILSRQAGDSLNMRAALWHMATDALGSLAALASGTAVLVAAVVWVDVVASVFIAVLVAAAAWELMRDTTAIILEAAPSTIDQTDLVDTLTSDPDIESIHHPHVWSLDSETVALSAHVVLASEPSLHGAQLLGDRMKDVLADQYGIDHATLEYESHDCSVPPVEVDGSA